MHKAATAFMRAKGPQLGRRVTLITFLSEHFRQPPLLCAREDRLLGAQRVHGSAAR